MKRIDELLAYKDRTLRTYPGKLLLGPTGKRLFADYLDKAAGFWGRIDFIHKMNIPGLFRVDCDACPTEMDEARAVWYPSHLYMRLQTESVDFEENKYIAWDDVAVSCQRWTNLSDRFFRLTLRLCEGLGYAPCGDGAAFVWDSTSHDITLVGAAYADSPILRDGGISVAPGETVCLTIAVAVDDASRVDERAVLDKARAYASRPEPLKEQEEEYASWFADVPDFDCSDPLYTTTWWYRWYILRNAYAQPDAGNFRHATFYEGRSHKVVKNEYAPWGHEFTQLIPLSTPLHVTDARWKADGEPCRQALLTLLDSMDRDGIFRTMMLDKFSFTFGNYNEWALYGYALVHPDDDFIRDVLPEFKRNVKGVWELFRDGRDDLQIAYNHRRTGKEYQPAYWYFRGYPDNASDEASYDWLKRVDLSVYLYLNARGVQKLCERVGDAEAGFFGELANRLQKSVSEKMWDEETGYFYDLHHQTEQKAMVKSVVGFYPLWAGWSDEKYLPAIDALLDEKQFLTGCGLASVSRECPVFMPQGSWKGQFLKGRDGCMWDGPSWPYTTCIALDAIATQSKLHGHRYDRGFTKLFREYCWQHFRNQSLHEPYLVEHYNAVTGEPLSDDVDYNHSFYIDLVVRHVAGLEPTEQGFDVRPLDIGLAWFTLKDVPIKGRKVSVEYRRGERFEVRVDGKMVFSHTGLGEYSHRF